MKIKITIFQCEIICVLIDFIVYTFKCHGNYASLHQTVIIKMTIKKHDVGKIGLNKS